MQPPLRELTLEGKICLIEKAEKYNLSRRQLAKTQASSIFKRKPEFMEMYAYIMAILCNVCG